MVILMFGFVGAGMSVMYMLKSDGERTPPCGTPECMMRLCEEVPLYVVKACLPLV